MSAMPIMMASTSMTLVLCQFAKASVPSVTPATMKIPPIVGVSFFSRCISSSVGDELPTGSRKRRCKKRMAHGPPRMLRSATSAAAVTARPDKLAMISGINHDPQNATDTGRGPLVRRPVSIGVP